MSCNDAPCAALRSQRSGAAGVPHLGPGRFTPADGMRDRRSLRRHSGIPKPGTEHESGGTTHPFAPDTDLFAHRQRLPGRSRELAAIVSDGGSCR